MEKYFGLLIVLCSIGIAAAFPTSKPTRPSFTRRITRQEYPFLNTLDTNYQSFAYPYHSPQYNDYYNFTTPSPTYHTEKYTGPTVNCGKVEVSPGVFNFDCSNINSDAITLKNEHVVGLVANGGTQEINIPIKNYKIEEFIRGAIKSDARLRTLVNVLLQKPESLYNVHTSQDNRITLAEPDVNIRYEGVSPTVRTFNHNTDSSGISRASTGGSARFIGTGGRGEVVGFDEHVVQAVPAFGLRKRQIMVNGRRF